MRCYRPRPLEEGGGLGPGVCQARGWKDSQVFPQLGQGDARPLGHGGARGMQVARC